MGFAVGGSIESVSLKGREFAVAADAEGQRKLGGKENEVQSNGDGTARLIQTQTAWTIGGLTLEVDDNRSDGEFLQDLADDKGFWDVAITYASGKVYQGRGQISGEMPTSSKATTAAVTLSGPGKLTPQ